MKTGKTIFMGDSITQGYGVARKDCWVTGIPGAVNRGIDGDTTSGMLRRFDAHVLRAGADRVVLMGGINDIGEGSDWSTPAYNLRLMCEKAIENGIEPVLATCVQPDYDEFLSSEWAYVLPNIKYIPYWLEKLNAWIRGYARERGILCIDFAEEFPKRLTMDYCRYFLEGEHPNHFGHAVMREIAIEVLGYKTEKSAGE